LFWGLLLVESANFHDSGFNLANLYISTNNIARGMVRVRHTYAFNLSKIRFHPNTKLPTDTSGKSEKRFALIFLSPGPTLDKPSRSSVDFFFHRALIALVLLPAPL
jgi:hypothetical protein